VRAAVGAPIGGRWRESIKHTSTDAGSIGRCTTNTSPSPCLCVQPNGARARCLPRQQRLLLTTAVHKRHGGWTMALKLFNRRHWTGIVCCRAGCALGVGGLSTAPRTPPTLPLELFGITAARRLETQARASPALQQPINPGRSHRTPAQAHLHGPTTGRCPAQLICGGEINKKELAAPLLNRGRPSVLWGDSWTPTWPSCRARDRAGGCHQCVVRVRERIAPNAGSVRALLM
jgi:hypothetical protein